MPKAAKTKSAAGAKAFTEYYFALLDFTAWTNDSDPMKNVSSRGCKGCAEFIDTAERNAKIGAWNAGGERKVSVYTARVIKGTSSAAVNFGYEQKKMAFYNPDGSLYGDLPKTTKPVLGSLSLVFEKSWKATTLTFVED